MGRAIDSPLFQRKSRGQSYFASLSRSEFIEVEVEFQHIDTGFTEHANGAAGDVLLDKLPYLVFADLACFRHASCLEVRSIWSDVGIEP